MREKIHPKYYPEATVICACGNTWKVGSTKETLRTDLCSKCHPFYTGEQRIVDTAGQVDRFMRRLERRTEVIAQQEVLRETEKAEKAEKAATAKRKSRAK
jgi:large subunit ribosomal protein L31